MKKKETMHMTVEQQVRPKTGTSNARTTFSHSSPSALPPSPVSHNFVPQPSPHHTTNRNHMKKTSTLLMAGIVMAFATSLQAADKAEVESHYKSYHDAGKAVVEMALTKKVDAAEVEKKVNTMLTAATWVAGEYAKAHPKGEKFLKVVTDNIEAMRKLSYKELEHEWHDLNHFTKSGSSDLGIDVKAEENEHFTDPVHSIVHPLLVLKAAQAFATSKDEGQLKSIKEEMEEGLEQMEKCRSVLTKK